MPLLHLPSPWQHVMQRYRRTLVESQLLGLERRWERVEGVAHLIVERLHRLDEMLDGVEAKSRDFR